MEAATADTSHELRLVHRYEMDHERSLRWALRQLMALEKSGADLHDEPEASAAAEAGPEAVAAGSGGEDVNGKSVTKCSCEKTCKELASVGTAAPLVVRPVALAGTPGGRRGPTGADPGPGSAPGRR